jgi:hypothetical protein
MARFHSVPTWDRHDRELSKDAKVLRSYLQRCPTRSSEGIFCVSQAYIVADTALTEAEVDAAFAELSEAKLFDYDADAEVALDRVALKTNPLRNPRDKTGRPIISEKTGEMKIDKRIPNAVRIFENVPDSHLKVEFVCLADKFSPDLADAIRADSTHAYPSPLRGPSKPLASLIEGPPKDRVETSSYEESQSRDGFSKSSQEHEDECKHGFAPASWCEKCIALKSNAEIAL